MSCTVLVADPALGDCGLQRMSSTDRRGAEKGLQRLVLSNRTFQPRTRDIHRKRLPLGRGSRENF